MSGLVISDLTVELGDPKAPKRILRGIDLEVPSGQITGLAGESGSGKTVTGLTVCGLQPAGSRVGGRIRLDSARMSVDNLLAVSPKQLNRLRGREVAMIFQDPTASLHPMISIGGQLTDHMRLHLGLNKREATSRAIELLERVRVPEPDIALSKYPHQFSGGQLQRVAIAIAIACDPAVLIADEPTTALDVTVQAGILRLLRELCDSMDLAIMLVTHDLGVMSAVADTVAVMHNGTIVEHGSRYQVIREPTSPYTKSLIDSLPAAPVPADVVHEVAVEVGIDDAGAAGTGTDENGTDEHRTDEHREDAR